MNEVWKKPPVSFEAYQAMVGKEIGVSSWHLVDQSRINLYADVIEDHQFIHVDPERAKRETSNANTAPTCPIETSATKVLKSSRPAISVPVFPRSRSSVRIWDSLQPSSRAISRSAYWRSVLS